MIHLGDITKINGAQIQPVDCITAGSPCQDLSVAGKRAGLGGERSGLFMEQIRIIKEMRENDRNNGRSDEYIRPRYMVWENVPGAFSSNKGEDFRCVLEETAKIAERDAVIPKPPKWKWSKSGAIMGDGWSIAWRVHDAQFWGVPQRRKRIALVADFGGESAPEILFERKGMRRDSEARGETGEGAAADVRSGVEETGMAISFQERAGKPGGGKGILIQDGHTGALSTLNNQSVCYPINTMVASRNNNESRTTFGVGDNGEAQFTLSAAHEHAVCYGICSDKSNSMLSGNPHSGIYEADTSRTLDLNGGSPACNQGGMAVVCLEGNGSRPSHKGDGYAESETMYTLNSTEHHAIAVENHPNDSRVKVSEDGIVQTLSSRMGTGGGNVPMVMEEPYNATTGSFMRAGNRGVAETLAARDYKDPQIVCQSVVRRLTPLECERLQGYPDGWTDIGDWTDSKGKKHKGDADSPRYKALGNSIALPFWFYLLRRISAQYERPATLGSLFDGIGGFPLCWERCNGNGTARWASEIEEFPIAVTKHWFGE